MGFVGLQGEAITSDEVRLATENGQTWSACSGLVQSPGAATLGFQLFNPANSGKNILIYSLLICNAAAGFVDVRKTAADVSSITGWTNTPVTPVNNGSGGASAATCGYSNTTLTGGLLGNTRETTNSPANSPVETLTNGECIWLPNSASIAGIALYPNLVGATKWSVTVGYIEFPA